MLNSTSNSYILRREILSFFKKISKNLAKPDKKFIADMTYGILTSGSCLLTDIVDQLHEKTKKVNAVERLTKHLAKGTSKAAVKSYLSLVHAMVPSDPVVFIDDSDVTKPDGLHFENLGLVRDGSRGCVNTPL